MTPPIIDPDTLSPAVHQEIITTLVALAADPLVANLATPLEQFYQQKWRVAVARETDLSVEEYRVEAMILVADQHLDDFVDELDTVLLRLVNKDRTDPLYAFFFGHKRPFELKRPVLSAQLETMRGFVAPLKTSSHTELGTLGARLEGLIADADTAVTRQQAATIASKTFWTLGERKTCLDELNALRQSTAGILSEMPHKHPEKHLPVNYVERFFRRPSRRTKSSKDLTIGEIRTKIAEQDQVLTLLKAQLDEALAREAAAAHLRAEKNALENELAEAEKVAAEAKARVAAIKAKIG